jgi:hypothetical protein
VTDRHIIALGGGGIADADDVGTELSEAISAAEGSGVYAVAPGDDGAAVETAVPCRMLAG